MIGGAIILAIAIVVYLYPTKTTSESFTIPTAQAVISYNKYAASKKLKTRVTGRELRAMCQFQELFKEPLARKVEGSWLFNESRLHRIADLRVSDIS